MALRGFEDYTVIGVDRDENTLAFARAHGAATWSRRTRRLPSPLRT